jgi:hypothetical protein
MFQYFFSVFLSFAETLGWGAASILPSSPWNHVVWLKRLVQVFEQFWCSYPLKGPPSNAFLFFGWQYELVKLWSINPWKVRDNCTEFCWMKIQMFCNVLLCWLVKSYWLYREACCLHLQGTAYAAAIPEDEGCMLLWKVSKYSPLRTLLHPWKLHQHHCEIPKSCNSAEWFNWNCLQKDN